MLAFEMRPHEKLMFKNCNLVDTYVVGVGVVVVVVVVVSKYGGGNTRLLVVEGKIGVVVLKKISMARSTAWVGIRGCSRSVKICWRNLYAD